MSESNHPNVTRGERNNVITLWRDFFQRHRENSETNNTTRDTILTSTNQRENKYWGDELQEKEQGMMRIYSINVNGLSIDRRGGKFSDICSAIKEVQCDIFCGQEHNLDTTQAIVRKILYDTAKQHWERLRLNLGTSPIEYKTQFKPGGTFMLTVGHTTGRTIEQTQDKWGRWVTTQFQGRGDSKLAVVNVYQVVDKHGESGVLSTTRQQQTLLMQAEDSVTDPRKAFKRDLRQDLQGFRTQGFELLILGDFNETFGEDIDGIESIANDLGLLHLMKKRHSTISLPATYARGQRCIDYALGTARVHSSLHAAGYEPFNQRVHTDHRGYFLDFNTAILFGMETPTLANRDSRMLQSWNVPQMTAYLRYKYDLLEKQNAFIRGERLTHLGNRHAFAERLDGDVLQASLIAEKKTHRYREPAWSVELAEARKTVSILSKTLSALRTGLNLNHILLHDMSAMNTRFDLPRTRQSCSIALRKAKVTVRTIVKQSYNTRDTERKRKIQILERSNNAIDRSTVKHLKRMKKSEEIRQLFGKLRSIQRTQERRGVTRLEIPIHPEADPKSCTEWQQIDIPDKILDHLIKRNQYHFGQAHGTPFTIPPLSDQLGFTANTAASHDILTGQFDSQQLDSNVQLLISHLRQVQEMEHEPARPTITDEEYVAKLQIWSENTTTSPSGLHLGHYKALIGRHTHSLEAPNHAVPPEFATIRDELNFKQQAMRRLHLQLLNYALERGYAYSRWKTVANTILFKDTDNYRIHRTRVIHLYEADYNMALGIKWRAAMHQAEDLKCLNDGQYGSRPNRRANDPVILEELQFEISRATRMPVALTSYDAMACYDRIIPSVAMLASRKYGIPETVANMNAETLQGATYRLKTEMGLAEKGYSHDHNGLPIYGTGQGSGNSPAIWCFVSSTLFDCYEEQAHAAYYCDPTRNLEVQLGMTGFVDDCGGQVTDHQAGGAPDRERLRQKVEHNAQSWTNLLSASGGALELTKCSCHMVQWQFTAQGAPVLVPSNSNDPIQVTVTDPHTRISHHVQMLSPFTAHKTLGHYKEPAGTQSTQAQALQKKSDTITEFLWTNRLSRMEAWTYYYACYLPAVTYPLPASSMTEKQLATVQRKALSIIVARCGYNRNTKKEILFGPASLGGANFRDLYVEQGIGQVTLFLRHWRGFTQISKMLRIAVSWFQLTVGSSTPILENTRMVLPHLESKWIGSLRTFLAKIQGSLRLDATYVQPKQRVQDEYIMDRVMESGKFTEAEIRRINYCRIYLRAVTVSDIASIAGDRLDMHKIRGSPSVESSASRLEWPRQDKPAPREWSLWKSANTLWSTVSGQLLTPLGQWTSPIHDQRQSHYAYQSPGHIFIRTGEQYRAFTRTSDQFFGGHGKLVDFADIADDAQPVSVSYDDSNLWSITDETKIQYLRPSPPAITFDQYIHTLDPWEITLLRHQELYADPRAIGFALEDGFYAASDGSVIAEEKGSYGWTISTVLGERASTGTGPVGGSQLQPYRAEAVAMLSLLCFLHRLAEFIGKHDHWYGVIVTDSQSLLDTLGNWLPQVIPTPPKIPKSYFISPYTEVLLPEWDVLIEIYHLLRRMPHITLEYVKSHQDRHQPYHQLSLKAQLNVDADAAAKQYQRTHANIHPLAMLLPHTGALLDLPDGTITSNFPDRMRHQAWGGPLKKYMQEKYNWSASTMDAINWKAQTSALQRQFHRKTHMTKLIHDILPTNSKVHRADKTKQRCPECPCKKEDRDHVLQCPAASRQQIKHDMMQRFQHGCEKHKTDPDLQNLLLKVVRAWMDQPADETYTPQEQNFPITLADLIRTQSAIGWRQLFNGRFSIQWAQRQDEYYARLDTNQRNRRQTGQHWQTNIIGELWEAWFLIWEKRNQDIHGFDVHSKAEATRRKVNQSLREIYDLRHQLEPSVRELLEEDVDVHHRRPTWVNQNWLAVHGPLVATSVRKFKNGVLRGVRSIRDYMVRTDN
jgi:exonuclease III